MNQKKQLLKNTAIIAIGKLSTQIVSFLLLPLYTAKLSTEEFGTYDFFVTLSVFLLPIITLLMEESMFRFLIDADDLKSKKRTITATIVYTAVGTVIFTILAAIIMGIIHYEYAVIFIIFIISNILLGLSNALSRGMGKVNLYSLSNFILGVITIILNILFIVTFKLGVNGLLWSNIIANTATAVIMFYKLHLPQFVSKKDFSRETLGKMIRYSAPLVPNNLSWVIISLSDRLMLTQMIGADANGIYAVANKFPNIVYTCYGFFSTAWKESAARILKEENKSQYYNSIYKDVKFFLKAIVLGLIAIMPLAFPLLVNESYNDAYKYIPILIISIYYTNMSNFYGGIFTAYKNTKIMGSTTAVAAVINIVINIIFIPKFGIYAATFSTLISNIVVYFYRRYKIMDYIKLKEKFNYVFWILLVITLITYYKNNMILNIIVFLLVVAYCIFTNKNFIMRVSKPVISKVQSFTKRNKKLN
ncbi:membrane protein involved in the export of O-antigen and teichoic acid [Clostridium sp. CAG:780]|nr:membrane protein involved in the export of O-antigen and teichoic acid [Clostridium sp. CAG:780]